MDEVKDGGCIAVRYIRLYGIEASCAVQRCAERMGTQGEVTAMPGSVPGECQLCVAVRGESEAGAQQKALSMAQALRALLGENAYAVLDAPFDSMEEAVGRALTERGLTVATAESCTGGLVAARLVNYPGISAALNEAHVTYANAAKVRYCGVKQETLDAWGAVSGQTAREMAQGLRERSGADIVVATTGIAGPGGGTPEKPVGLVYVGCADVRGVRVERLMLSGNREQVRTLAALRALDMVRRAALGLD